MLKKIHSKASSVWSALFQFTSLNYITARPQIQAAIGAAAGAQLSWKNEKGQIFQFCRKLLYYLPMYAMMIPGKLV
jgi:hypothetical protein